VKVPFSDLSAQHKEIKKEINQGIRRVIQKGDFILGDDVGKFETEFAQFCDSRYAIGVSSGTAALFLALKGFDIGQGDEVIVPDFTFIATALAVSYTGAKPVFVDIEEKTYNIDPEKIRKAITPHTRAILPVHLYGQPANMAAILKIAKEYKLKIVEDACQAHGAKVKTNEADWQIVGGIGDAGCFSFYPTKNLGGMGDGGMLVTNDEALYKKLLILRDCGRVSRYEHAIIGFNSRLDTLQAAILRAKLKRVDAWNAMRQKAAKIYDEYLQDTRDVVTPHGCVYANHIYHVYAIRAPRRDALFQALRDKGIGVIIHYPIPLHLQKAYRELDYQEGDFPVSEKVAQEILSLPIYPHISKTEIKFVANSIKKFLKE
jgi:dTDP-4-amino-4,6-dideoxygalactose transaminase